MAVPSQTRKTAFFYDVVCACHACVCMYADVEPSLFQVDYFFKGKAVPQDISQYMKSFYERQQKPMRLECAVFRRGTRKRG